MSAIALFKTFFNTFIDFFSFFARYIFMYRFVMGGCVALTMYFISLVCGLIFTFISLRYVASFIALSYWSTIF